MLFSGGPTRMEIPIGSMQVGTQGIALELRVTEDGKATFILAQHDSLTYHTQITLLTEAERHELETLLIAARRTLSTLRNERKVSVPPVGPPLPDYQTSLAEQRRRNERKMLLWVVLPCVIIALSSLAYHYLG